jgi:hypothetical protein
MLHADFVTQHTVSGVGLPVPRDLPAATRGQSTGAPVYAPQSAGEFVPANNSALVATPSRKISHLFRKPATVPPPLTSFRHHRSVSVDQLKSFAAYHDPSSVCLVAQDSASVPAAPNLHTCELVHAFRESESCKCGCMVSDVAWFFITHVGVAAQSAAGTGTSQVLGGAEDGVLVGSSADRLSASSTLSSGPCLASFIAVFQHLLVEIIFARCALELFKGTSPGMLIHDNL